MFTGKSTSRIFSVLFIIMFLLTSVLPMQTATASTSNTTDLPAGLSADEWTQIQSMLPAAAVPNNQQAYIKASNTDQGEFFFPGDEDEFGSTVSLSGNTLVVGAPRESSNATGVNGNQADESATYSGAVYIFTRNGTTWSQQAYIKASNTDAFDYFGSAVSLSGDTLVVGAIYESSNATGVNGNQADNSAYGSGAVYVFTRSGTIWSQQAYLKASNTEADDNFGNSISVFGDTLVVGAYREDSNATGVNGDQADNSADVSGATYVFTRSGTTWSQQAYIKASNTGSGGFGSAISLFDETLVVGAPYESSNATGVNGNQTNDLAPNSGAAYIFTRNGTTWSQQAYIKASNTDERDFFGSSVSLSSDTLVVGATEEDSNAIGVNGANNNLALESGAAYVFTRIGDTWSQQAYLKASNTGVDDRFGLSVSLSGDTLVVGSPFEDSNATGVNGNQEDDSATLSGAAYIFTRNGENWSQQSYLKASNTDLLDGFSWGMSLSGDTLAVGAFGEDSNATGVNGNQTNNLSPGSGATYVYSALAVFADVPTSYWASQYIERLYNAGITGGCSVSPLMYCPEATVTRAQMAIFILRGIHSSAYTPPAATGTVFTDVPLGSFAADWIEQLALEGVTAGCGGGNYCPEATITRAQMAIFLLRGEHGNAYTPPAATGTVFGDVPLGSFADAWIEQLAAEGITSGCGGGNYCPDANVTRAEMAVFLVRAFGLP